MVSAHVISLGIEPGVARTCSAKSMMRRRCTVIRTGGGSGGPVVGHQTCPMAKRGLDDQSSRVIQ